MPALRFDALSDRGAGVQVICTYKEIKQIADEVFAQWKHQWKQG